MSEDPDPSSIDHGTVDIQITVEDSTWHSAVPSLVDLVEQVSSAALGHPEVTDAWVGSTELSILLADDAAVRELNRTYRARDAATNVLSFAYCQADVPDVSLQPSPGVGTGDCGQDPISCLGDVALARETVEQEAAAQGKSVSDHLSHLLVHGVLHLCGFDHESESDADRMERVEREILADMGIADPYRPISVRQATPVGQAIG